MLLHSSPLSPVKRFGSSAWYLCVSIVLPSIMMDVVFVGRDYNDELDGLASLYWLSLEWCFFPPTSDFSSLTIARQSSIKPRESPN